jgi:hypothetical protein
MNTAVFELVQAWLFFPFVMVTSVVCIGMAVFRISRLDLNNLLILPTGFAMLIVLGQITTLSSRIAPHSPIIFLVCVFFCAIYFVSEILSWFKFNLKAVALGFSVFYIHGLPILMSGTPTFAGWIKLDDGSSWLAITDQMLLAGRDTSILDPSSHEAIVQILLSPAVSAGAAGNLPYPSGSFIPLGIFSNWIHIDPAWTMQPYIAVAALILCVTLLALFQAMQIPTWTKNLASAIAPTSALFFGYEMWGGIKELLLAPLIVLVTAFIPLILERPNEPRRVIPFAIACSAYVLVFSISGLVWLFVPVLFLVVGLTSKNKRIPWRHALVFLGTFVAGSLAVLIPIAKNPRGLIDQLSFAQSSTDIGNLLGPLKFTQIFGVWLTGDFRYPAEFPVINIALLLLAGLLFVLGCYFLLTNNHGHIAALGIWVTLLSAFALKGNAWISGKTLAMASPIVLAIAFCALGYLANQFSIEAVILSFVLSSGVIVSYAYTFHEVWLAPYEQLKELEVIGLDNSYPSPALMTESSPYGGRHFLRTLDAEVPGLLRRNLIPLKDGKGLANGGFADIDEFSIEAIQKYETLILRTSATSSRPPGNYDLKFSGNYYEVWQKNPDIKSPVEHYSFGTKKAQSAIPECSFLESEIVPKVPGNNILVSSDTSSLTLPIVDVTGQTKDAGNKSVFESKFEAKNSSTFDLWVEGFTKGTAELFIDGTPVAKISHVLNQGGNMTKIGDVELASGPHVLKVVTDSPWLIPGSGGLSYPMGPFYLSDQNEKHSVEVVAPENLNSLCTKPVDWIELVPQ